MVGKALIYILVAVALVSLFTLSSHVSYHLDLFDPDEQALVYELAPSTDAWGLFDPETGVVFFGDNTDTQLPIASVTKLFTAYAAFKSDEIESLVTISWADLATEGRAGKLAYGDTYTLHELLFPLLIESSNDAGKAIETALNGEYTFRTELLIDQLSLSHTEIVDPTGLSAGNVSTVVDLARFYSHVKSEAPHIIDITTLPLYIGKHTGWVNTGPGIQHGRYRGGKHGFTPEAGNTFIGTFVVGGTEVGIVLLGSDDLDADLSDALSYLGR